MARCCKYSDEKSKLCPEVLEALGGTTSNTCVVIEAKKSDEVSEFSNKRGIAN